jgi:hypothetical protein
MPDEPKKPKDTPDEQLDQLSKSAETGELSPKERFRKTSHIGLLMAYDLIDKLRYLEKETMSLPDDQIDERVDRLVGSVEMLRTAYLSFADQDF